jgi:biopolymer transport protein TolQ
MQNKMDIIDILLNSGIVVQGVLILLIIASVLSWAIIFQKRKDYRIIEYDNRDFLETFESEKSLSKLYESARENEDSSFGIMYMRGYEELNKIKEQLQSQAGSSDYSNYIKENGIQALERSLRHGVNDVNLRLDDKLSMLASVGSVSPFIGLFGTVWGIINSFTGLATGGGSIEAVAPGIAEALVATAVGLAAAIPATSAYNMFVSRVSKMNSEMDSFAQDFINLIERNLVSARK